MKVLIVVDMQKDFIDGSLGTREAQTIVPNVAAKIAAYPPEAVFATRDTHAPDYLTSCEGRHLRAFQCHPAESRFPRGGDLGGCRLLCLRHAPVP